MSYDNKIPGQDRRGKDTVKTEATAATSILDVKPAPVAQAAPRQPANNNSSQIAPARREISRSWGGWLERVGGITGKAPIPARIAAGLGSLVAGLVCGGITSNTMQTPNQADNWLSWAVTFVFTTSQLVLWYMAGNKIVMAGGLIILIMEIGFVTSAFHTIYKWPFDLVSGKTWFYILLASVFSIFPEPLSKIALKGRLGD